MTVAFEEFVREKLIGHDARFSRVDGELTRLGVLMEEQGRTLNLVLEVCLSHQAVSDGLRATNGRLDEHEARIRAVEALLRAKAPRENEPI